MKKTLKTVAIAIAAALALAGCQKEDKSPTVSFEKANEVIEAESSVTVKVVLSEAADTDLNVPFTVSSTASSEEAYTIGENGGVSSFTVKAGESEGVITVANNGTELSAASLTLRIGDVKGYKLGMNPQIVISLVANERVIYTFEKPKMRITENSTVTVNVRIAGENSGDKFKSNKEFTFPISIDKASTAAGYTLSANEIVFPAGSNSASFTVTAGAEVPEKGASLILSLAPGSERFIAGAVPSTTVNFAKSTFMDAIAGSWKMAEDLHVQDDNLGMIGMVEAEGVIIPFPVIDKEKDSFKVSFSEEDGSVDFAPSFEGDLKRYFRACKLSSPVIVNIKSHPVSGESYDTYAVTFSSVNFDFATADSEFKEAKIYMYQPLKDGSTEVDTDVLEIFLFPFTRSTYEQNFKLHNDFGGNLESYGMKVVDMMPEIFSLHYKFTRAAQ